MVLKIPNKIVTSPKGFSASKCNEGNWIHTFKTLEIFWIFWGVFQEDFLQEFFGRNFLVEIFWEDFLGFLWDDFFFLWAEITKDFIFLSRFSGNFLSMKGRYFQPLKVRQKLIALTKKNYKDNKYDSIFLLYPLCCTFAESYRIQQPSCTSMSETCNE